MADQEEEDLRTALRMSMQQHSPPEPKRSKPRDSPVGAPTSSSEESPEVKSRRLQRELMAAAAEKRMLAAKSYSEAVGSASKSVKKGKEFSVKDVNLGKELSETEANQLFSMVFGDEVSKDILAQWSNQGIRFSPDPETSMGLVQHEGGPCGVLATIQAFVLKNILFFPDEFGKVASSMAQNLGSSRLSNSECVASNNFAALTEDVKRRALIRSMSEILFLCGANRNAVIATLTVSGNSIEGSEYSAGNEIISNAFEGLSIESGLDLQKVLRVTTCTSQESALQRLGAALPVFQSRVILTPTHLAIVMEYASGGELFERICNAGRFSEDEARFFFQQLISGVSYCHAMQVCHRDLKLENTLLDGSPAPRLKICDFGYSKSSVLHSQPKSTVGTPAYIAPEVLLKKEYDGKIADVWSCGVTLYVMLVGAYPFEDPEDPKNFRKTIQRILNVQYSIPDYVLISPECRHLISRIFVADPTKRITIPEIRNHEWFLKNLPADLVDERAMNNQYEEPDQPMQTSEEIMQIIAEAGLPAAGTQSLNQYLTGSLDIDDDMEDDEESDPDLDLDIDSSGEVVYAM